MIEEGRHHVRTIETIHNGRYDIAMNLSADQMKVAAVLPLVEEGLTAWIPYHRRIDDHGNLFVDAAEPTFIAKVRSDNRDSIRLAFMLKNITDRHRHIARARNSIYNELAMAPRVRAVIDSHEVQEFTRNVLECASMSLCEPLVGVIDRQTQKKVLVYEWIPDATGLYHGTDNTLWKKLRDMDDSLTYKFEAVFRSHGIDSTADVGATQCLLTQDKAGVHIHVLDIEQFTPIARTIG
ncbi:MAG TPA: hypothetical protein VMR81_04855 [Patescibacteria group bacterium]|nr:hypothetical protein [Patescibacteria group bacterium]